MLDLAYLVIRLHHNRLPMLSCLLFDNRVS